MKSVGLPSGTLLRHNTFRIEKILGAGGFGITYLATDLNLMRFVAIKEFYPSGYCRRESDDSLTAGSMNVTGDRDMVGKMKAKFLKEARNIAKFDHPGIVKIHAAFEENNTAYYVMDYIEGQSLEDLVDRKGPLSVDQAAEYVRQVGDSLEYVHLHKINHLDVKPSNIIVRSRDDRPILIDFGLAKQYDSKGKQTSTTVMGVSHGFSPIEQYSGIPNFSPQTDVYSLAATLYFLVSGKIPPDATVLSNTQNLVFPANFPPQLKGLIIKGMSVWSQRHQTVKQFLEHLSSIVRQSTSERAEERFEQKSHRETKIYLTSENSDKLKYILGGLIAAILVSVVIIVFFVGKNSVEDTGLAEDPVISVENMPYTTPLGESLYTGDLDTDSLPNGNGKAVWEKGDAKEYNGEWVHGNMEGKASYTHRSGDTFEGTFKNNEYEQGRYTVKKTGEYYEGTYKNGQPDVGKWYNKNGKEL